MAKACFIHGVLVVALTVLGSACSGNDSDSATSVPPESAQSVQTLTLPGFPHSIDIYQIDAPDKAVVYLHGAVGRNEQFAHYLGLNSADAAPTDQSVNWAWLNAHKILAVFPQGQAIPADPLSYTWSNHVMTSGQDDVAFLRALAAYVRSQYGVPRVYVMGHSNGGMMVNRMWCESPETFDGYVSLAGPASRHYLAQATACAPGVAQPYYGIVGDQDEVLQVNGDWEAVTWEINPLLAAGADTAFVDPVLIGEWHQHLSRAGLMCGEQPQLNQGISDGMIETWTACSGRLKVQRARQAGHAIESLEATAGVRMIDAAAEFIEGL